VEDTSGCDFDSLLLVNPQTGFTVADENCGFEVDKLTFENQPYVFYPNARDDLKYTLIMVDQDDPFTEEDKDFLQWMVINISGTSLKYGVGEFYGETLVGKCLIFNQRFGSSTDCGLKNLLCQKVPLFPFNIGSYT
jgi:hypothetical protein